MARQHFVIVGAGHAGAHAAVELRRAGFAGLITVLGDEPHLPYERPPLSKELLLGTHEEATMLHPIGAIDEANIRIELNARVTAIDPVAKSVDLGDGRQIPFDRLLLATGGTARRLSIPGGGLACTLRTLDDALALKARMRSGQHVAVVGAGVIGLELASSAIALGCRVTVIEQQSGPMARSLHRDLHDYLTGLHRARGVVMRYDQALQSIEPLGQGVILHLAGGETIGADLVVAGIGLGPNLELAVAAGLAVSSGILVDAYGATSAADIYAAGDAVAFWHPDYGRHLHWQNWQHAQNHGKAVARAMAGVEGAPYAPLPWFWSDQHGINLQVTGFPEEADETVVRGDMAANRFIAFHRRDERIVGATFVDQGGAVRPTQALIRSGAAIPKADLADPAVSLQKLARGG